MASPQRFHRRTGRLVELKHERRSAERKYANEEFNDGMVFSERPLKTNELFSVRVNKKISSWSGSIEIGVMSMNPSEIEIPKGAIAMRDGNWLVSGTSVTVNGAITNEEYCQDLDTLDVGDTVGILRNNQHEIHILVNGSDQGIAAICSQEKVWAVVDLYGKCCSISIISDSVTPEFLPTEDTNDNMSFSEVLFNTVPSNNFRNPDPRNHARLIEYQSCNLDGEALAFYSKCGSLIRLLNGGTTAVRARHQDEFNNGVVMTSRTLKNDELFEIRINTLTDKWSGSIEMGVTTHAPDLLDIPSTMTNLRSGTVMLSGCGIITNGKGTRKEYLDFHLDELKVGDYVGLMRKSQGTLHFFINGVDQGVAANHIPPHVYGVVDLYGRAVSVSIIPHHSVFERDRRNKAIVDRMLLDPHLFEEHGPLLFSPLCGKHIRLSPCKSTALRQNPLEDFNHAVVLTARTLEPGEMFTVRVEDVVDKWSGSLEIGVTTCSPESLNFPATMTNVRSGTWIMTATGVMINGVTVVDDYGSNMDNLKISDTLGVCRKANGNLHFYINDVDQGLAASGVPDSIFAMIDLYGQVSKAKIVSKRSVNDDDGTLPPISAIVANEPLEELDDVTFNPARTKLCVLTNNLASACRKNPNYFYDSSIVVLNSKLESGELCEFEINEIIPHWSGSFELGVTKETKFSAFPSSLIELKKNIWVWTGRSTFENGRLITDRLPYDSENLQRGSRIGVMVTERGIVGYFDGVEIGVLFSNVKKDVYPIINLYGKCAQVTLVESKKRFNNNENNNEISQEQLLELSAYTVLKNNHRFYDFTNGEFMFLNDHKVVLRRVVSSSPMLFSAKPLQIGELFEVLVNDTLCHYGTITIGVISIGDLSLRNVAPAARSLKDLKRYQPACLISGAGVWVNNQKVREYFCPELYTLDFDDRVGLMLCDDEAMILFYNGKSLGKIAGGFSIKDLPYLVIHMGPRIQSLEVVENAANIKEMKGPPSLSDSSSEEDLSQIFEEKSDVTQIEVMKTSLYKLSPTLCGKNVRITEDGLTATRVGSYNQAVVVTDKPFIKNSLFQVKVKSLDEKWKSSLSIGVTGLHHTEIKLAVDALRMTKLVWLFHDNSVFKNGVKIKDNYGPGLDTISVSQVVGVLIDGDGNLHLYVDGIDQGIAASDLPDVCYGVVDLYGSCDEIEVVKENEERENTEWVEKDAMAAMLEINLNTSGEISDKMCLNRDLCARYLNTLGIPTEFFTDIILCVCPSCFKYRGEPIQKNQGEPQQQFTQPVGWCKFALRTHPNVDFNAVSKYWNVAFYGTKAGMARKLLDLGKIPTDFPPTFDLRSKKSEEDFLAKKRGPAMISPNIKFIQDDNTWSDSSFIDPVSGISYSAHLAFQLYIQPSTFKVKSASPRQDCSDSAEKVEWIIKEQSTTILSHLLIKLDKLK